MARVLTSAVTLELSVEEAQHLAGVLDETSYGILQEAGLEDIYEALLEVVHPARVEFQLERV
jgi:hypothetical protein